MYSLANNCTKWNALNLFPLFSLFFVFLLSGCGSDSSFVPPEPIKDTLPPTIVSALPNETTASNFEVDFEVEIIFSERMNLSSLTTEGGIKLYSGKKEETTDTNENTTDELKPREAIITLSEIPVTSEDLITGDEIQIPATKINLRHSSGRFALNTAYTVLVESPARDLVEDDTKTSEDERNYIQGLNVVDFITQAGEWKTTSLLPNIRIETDLDDNETAIAGANKQFAPKIISNTNGATFAIWKQEGSIPGINQLWISRYQVNANKWVLLDIEKQVCITGQTSSCANAERIDNRDDTSVIEFQAAVNEQGQIAVVWTKAELPGNFVSVWANLFDGTKWLGVTEISASGLSNQSGDADSPRVVIDSQGNVVSIWREQAGQTTRIKTNLFQLSNEEMEDGIWTEAPSFIDDNFSTYTQNPALAMNANGTAIAVWSQELDGRLRIFSNRIRLSLNSDWQSPTQIDELSPSSVEFAIGDSTKPAIAVDDNGDAIAVWLKYDGQRNNVWYNRFTGNWRTEALLVETDRRGDADFPEINISKDSKALVTWTQRINTDNNTELKSRFFEALTGWETEKIISTGSQIHTPTVRFDREGNVNAIWQNGQSKAQIFTAYFSKIADTWSGTNALSEQANANAANIEPLFEDGRFLSVWEKIEGLDHKLNFTIFSD